MIKQLTLPLDSNERKNVPLYSGCYAYFAAALAGVAKHSKAGNDKHNPGEPLHHARGKSSDHLDCVARHSMDIGDMLAQFDRGNGCDELREAVLSEANAMSWRALAFSQELHERFGAPLAPHARLPKTDTRGAGTLRPPSTPEVERELDPRIIHKPCETSTPCAYGFKGYEDAQHALVGFCRHCGAQRPIAEFDLSQAGS